jgi:hypothetical protein
MADREKFVTPAKTGIWWLRNYRIFPDAGSWAFGAFYEAVKDATMMKGEQDETKGFLETCSGGVGRGHLFPFR